MDESQFQCPKCGVTLPVETCPACTLKALSQGTLAAQNTSGPDIPGLTIHEEVGEGGFGIVYRATQLEAIRRPVALKVLKPGVDTRQVLRRFEVERQALALLEHPHIARFYQAGETEAGYPWFTMEFITGQPISDALVGKDLATLIDTFLMVCGAVAFAHSKGVIHRDLKPSNILVTPDGTPKIIDFGVAKATGHTPGMTLYTADEVTAGTPAYMAPEKGSEADLRGDVFALGAILFELLTETLPPESGHFPAPSSLAIRQIPRSLDAIVSKAIHPKPNERYQSVPELAADLRKFQNGQKINLPLSQRRVLWASAVVLTLILIGTFFIFNDRPLPSQEDEQPQIVRLKSHGHPAQIPIRPDGARALGVFRTGGRTVLLDPRDGRELGTVPAPPTGIGAGTFTEDGERFILGHSNGTFRFYSSDDARPLSLPIKCDTGWVSEVRHLTIAGDKEPTILTIVESNLRAWREDGTMRWEITLVGPAYRIAIGPERKSAIIGSNSGSLNIIDLNTATKKIVHGPGSFIYEIKYSPDGKTFACASFDHTASLWTTSGKLIRRFKHTDKLKDLDFSPDGRFLATPSYDGSVQLWDLETGESLWSAHHLSDALAVCFSPDGKTLASGGRDDMLRLWDARTGEPISQPFSCGGDVDRIRFVSRKDQSLNLLIQTWNNEMLVIPREQIH